jgi:hypothetical protein
MDASNQFVGEVGNLFKLEVTGRAAGDLKGELVRFEV